LLEALDRLRVVTGMVVGVTEAVPSGCLPRRITQFLEQREGLAAVRDRRLVVAQLRLEPANGGEHISLSHSVAGAPKNVQRLAIAAERFLQPALLAEQDSHRCEAEPFVDRIVQFSKNLEGTCQMAVRSVMVAAL